MQANVITALVAGAAAAVALGAGLTPAAGLAGVGLATLVTGLVAGAWLARRAEAADLADPEAEPDPAPSPAALARQLLEKLPVPVLVIAANGRVEHANPAARGALPHVREGDHFAHVIRAPAFVEAVGATLADGEERGFRFTDFYGAERHYEARVARLPGEATHDEMPRTLVKIEDRTHALRAEQLRVDFIANASHELRTPLASVIGYIETLQNHARDDPEARERFLAIMGREAGRMQRLVDDLMSLSRIEQDEHVRPAETWSLNRIAGESVAALAPVAARRQVSLVVDLPAEGAEVTCDRDQIAQVFSNLIDNAMKYGRDGGTVRVTAAPPSPAHPSRYGVSVTDDGPGIAREHLHRLTERFYRVTSRPGRIRGGNGLGLAIVKHILNRHKGRLEITSTPGEGSSFTVWLPRATGAAVAGDAPENRAETPAATIAAVRG